MTQVTQRVVERHQRSAMMKPIPGDIDAPEMAPRHPCSIRLTHALRLQALGFELDVRANLVFEIALRATTKHQALSGVGPGARTRAMDSTSRLQRPVSIVS